MSADSDTLRALDVFRQMPAAPQIWKKLGTIGDDDPLAIRRCARVIAGDPVLAAGFVEASRGTPFLAVDENEVRRTIAARGLEATRCVVLSLLFRNAMLSWSRVGSPLDRSTWWQHSLGTALAAGRLAEMVSVRPLTCYAAGLLHDAGILAVDRFAPQILWDLMSIEDADGADEAPGRVLDAAHSKLGGLLAELWRLPAACPGAVLRHHEPMNAEPGNRTLASVVCVADVVMSPDWAWWYGGGPEEEYRNALAHLRLDEYALRNLREDTEAELRGARPLLRWPVPH